jgi:hypothetical protein
MNTSFQRLTALNERQERRSAGKENTRDIRRGYLVEVGGSIVGDRDGLVWFKAIDDNTGPYQVFNPGVIQDLRAGMYCQVERDPKQPARWQILQFDRDIYFSDQTTYETLPSNTQTVTAKDLEWVPGFPGSDPVNVHARAITDFAVRPTSPASMKVRVYSGVYPGTSNYEQFTGPVNSKDFTADIPGTAGFARIAAIAVDKTGTLVYTNGSTFVDGLPIPSAAFPSVPTDRMIISAVRLVNGMTAITEANFDQEIRPVFAPGGLAGAVDTAKVSKLVSPDGLTDPVLSADNAGDVTLAGTGTLFLPDDIVHSGDTDTLVSFETDKIVLQAGGASDDKRVALNDGFFGIGTTAASNKLRVTETYTDSTERTLASLTQTWSPSSTAGSVFPTVFLLTPSYDTTHTPAGGFLTSFRLFAEISDSGVLNVRNVDLQSTNAGAGTIGNITDVDIRPVVNSGGGAITIYRAINIENSTAAASNFGIRQQGSGMINRFQGSTRMGTDSNPTAILHVDQSSTTAAKPPLLLDQADLSEEMIEFNTTIGVGNPIEAVGAKTLTPTHFIRVTLPGGLSRYIPAGTIA